LKKRYRPYVLKVLGERLETTAAWDALWTFCSRRHEAAERRMAGLPHPWTDDPVVAGYRFTNVFRALDRTTQYLIREVAYPRDRRVTRVGHEAIDAKDDLFRLAMFQPFNKIDTWRAITGGTDDLDPYEENPRVDTYDRVRFGRFLAKLRGYMSIYTTAYFIPPTGALGTQVKHLGHARIIQWMIRERVFDRLLKCRSIEEAAAVYASVPTVGPFLSYQMAVSASYLPSSRGWAEDDFDRLGPGALNGMLKLFVGNRDVLKRVAVADLFRAVRDAREPECRRLGLTPPTLFGRAMTLVDLEHALCENDKYTRVVCPECNFVKPRFLKSAAALARNKGKPVSLNAQKRPKFTYKPERARPLDVAPWFPPKWRINGAAARWWRYARKGAKT